MKQLFLALFALATVTGLACAQSPGEIARVQGGASCAGCNLFQADLSYRDLPNLNLSGSRLRQADFSLATMNGTRFDNCDISVANMFGARFTGASFRNADLTRSILVGAYFHSADLSGATLTGANLSGAELGTARGLTQAQLNTACGDRLTELPAGLSIPACH